MKRFLFITVIIISIPLRAENRISVGLTAGYQYDTGMLSRYSGLDYNPGQNVSAGIVFKADMWNFFLRSGFEYSYPFQKGEIVNGSGGAIQRTAISFAEVPVYFGINFPVRDFGIVYMGAGGSYIFGFGQIETTSSKKNTDDQLMGLGFITGIEYELSGELSFLVEWEYMTIRGAPSASSSGTYRDFCADYSGHRIRLGFLYHFGRI